MKKLSASRIRIIFAVLLVVFVKPTESRLLPRPRPPVDLLLLNAHVITMDPSQPEMQAIAVQGDRIAWVGSDSKARRLFASASRAIDLHGATVLPGLIDAHVHLVSLGQSLLRLNLKDVGDEAEAIARVKERIASAAPNETERPRSSLTRASRRLRRTVSTLSRRAAAAPAEQAASRRREAAGSSPPSRTDPLRGRT